MFVLEGPSGAESFYYIRDPANNVVSEISDLRHRQWLLWLCKGKRKDCAPFLNPSQFQSAFFINNRGLWPRTQRLSTPHCLSLSVYGILCRLANANQVRNIDRPRSHARALYSQLQQGFDTLCSHRVSTPPNRKMRPATGAISRNGHPQSSHDLRRSGCRFVLTNRISQTRHFVPATAIAKPKRLGKCYPPRVSKEIHGYH